MGLKRFAGEAYASAVGGAILSLPIVGDPAVAFGVFLFVATMMVLAYGLASLAGSLARRLAK